MTHSRRFDAVLFDLDGVLVDSEPWWDGVRAAFAAAHDRPWGLDDQRAVMGANSRQWAVLMRDRLNLGHLDPHAIVDAVVAGVVDCYRTRPAPIIDGAPDVVRRIGASRAVAIASSAHRAVIDAAIDALGLHGVLDAVVSSDEVAHGKPAPDVYLLAASRLGVPPERCMVVEDSANGVRAGRAAGMFTVLVPVASVPPDSATRDLADLVLARLTDLDPDVVTA